MWYTTGLTCGISIACDVSDLFYAVCVLYATYTYALQKVTDRSFITHIEKKVQHLLQTFSFTRITEKDGTHIILRTFIWTYKIRILCRGLLLSSLHLILYYPERQI